MVVKNNNNNKKIWTRKKTYTSGFTILGHILLICFFVGLIVLISLGVNLTLIILNSTIDALLISVVYALGGTRERLDLLEHVLLDKNIVNQLDFEVCEQIIDDPYYDNRIVLCNHCGNQIFPEEKACSNCGEVKNLRKIKVQICKNCSEKILPGENFCKKCGKPKDN